MKRLSLFILAGALYGCTVGPNFRRPELSLNDGYLSPSDPQSSRAGLAISQATGMPASRWWERFGCPELNEFVKRAITHNLSLEASNATLASSRDALRAIAGAELPQVRLNARAEKEELNLATFGFENAGLGSNPEFALYSVGGGISYDLDLFGRRRRQLEQGAAQTEAQIRQTQAAHLAIAGQVVGQALQIAAVRARIKNEEALLKEDQKNVDLSEKRRNGGEGSLTDVLTAQGQYADDRSELPSLNQQLAEARHMLSILLSVAPAELGPTDFDLDQFVLPNSVPVALPSELVHRRPDILQAEAELHAAVASVGIATARRYPDISIGATLTQGTPELANLTKDAFRGYDLFAGVTAPIFDGGTLRAQQAEAVAQAKAADATYRQTILQAFSQVADLLSAIGTDSDWVSSQRESLAVAQNSLRLSRRSYEIGDATVLQVIDSERLLRRASSTLAIARGQQYQDLARLFFAAGGTWS